MNIGYIRVSSVGQNIDRQLIKMKELGIEDRFIFIDKQSGKDFDRDQYQAMKRIIREGDLVYIDALDRLGRDYDGIIREWKEITRNMGADIVVLENETLFDSGKFKQMGDMGKLMEDQFLSLLSFVAEQERKKIRQRQAEGIAVAKAEGKHLGRPQLNYAALSKEQKNTFETIYPIWERKEITAVEFMDKLNLKKNTFYKIVKEYEGQLE
jgi:DNA invertase Pin-like site-specific DNA recombinase